MRITQFWKISFLISLAGFLSCSRPESYLVNNQANLRMIERQDHQRCVYRGMDVGEWGDVNTEVYWRCRYNLVQERLIDYPISSASMENNAMIKKISEDILKKWNRARQFLLSKLDDNIETLDHSKCISDGYDIDSLDPAQVEAYYICRQNLVLERVPPAPGITNSYEAAILSKADADEYMKMIRDNKKTDKEVLLVTKMMSNYENCAGLKVRSGEFKKCTDANDEAKKCLGKIEAEKAKKGLEDKTYCAQQAFSQFPDDYAFSKYKSAKEIAREKKKKLDEKNEFTKKQAESSEDLQYLKGNVLEAAKNKDIDNNNARVSNDDWYDINKKTKLYSKIELMKLREQFVKRCNKSMEEKIPQFADKYINECQAIATNWDRK